LFTKSDLEFDQLLELFQAAVPIVRDHDCGAGSFGLLFQVWMMLERFFKLLELVLLMPAKLPSLTT